MAERAMRKYKCEFSDPDFGGRPKKTERLIGHKDSDLLGLGMQVVLQGGETNRHAHTGQDAAWLVLEGRARFYGKTDDEVFELEPMEGIFIPDGQDYWFESASDKPLKILRMSARDPRGESKRLNYEDLKSWQTHLGGERVTHKQA
ncbi:MAG TPA: cupin domain-containing protein [Candidatus Acidoferrales bacterium]|nr:cupin domain-containing protein [Candidatus Acidoferrales bacterium]